MTPTAQRATLAIRIGAVLIATVAFWQMAANLAGTYRDIDPSYLGYYFTSQLVRPICGILTAILLYALSRILGKLIARGLDQ